MPQSFCHEKIFVAFIIIFYFCDNKKVLFPNFITSPMKKRILLAGIAMGLCASMYAEDKLVVTGNGGTATSVEISKISEITFDGNTMLVVTPDGRLSFHTDDISQISFDLSLSGTDKITSSLSENLNISTDNGIVTVSAADGMAVTLDIFDIKGACRMSLRANGTVTADTSTLPKGVYIIKANDKVVKYIR